MTNTILDRHGSAHATAREIIDGGELIKKIDYEFCPRMFDSSSVATRIACTSIQDLLLTEGIVVDDIVLMSAFSTKLHRDPNSTQFQSDTCLYVVKLPDKRTVAVLYTGATITDGTK